MELFLFVEFAKHSVIPCGRSINNWHIGANKLCVFFFFLLKSQSEYEDLLWIVKLAKAAWHVAAALFLFHMTYS